MTTEREKIQNALIEKAKGELSEHFDSVIIIATYQDGETSCMVNARAGNLYAQIQSCRQFIERQQARTRYSELPDPADGGEENWKPSE